MKDQARQTLPVEKRFVNPEQVIAAGCYSICRHSAREYSFGLEMNLLVREQRHLESQLDINTASREELIMATTC